VPLLERVIARARAAGVDRFFVVSGYRGEELRSALDALSARDGTPITHIVNHDWQRANGVSVLKAKPYLEGPFLLTMCDHLVDVDILRGLTATAPPPGTVTLAVDFNISGSINDLDDVTRVKCSDGRIELVGKVIREFNAIDTGVFLCSPVIFDALEASQAAGDDSLSRTFDIRGRLWLDVDDPISFAKAEELLAAGRL
jgi:1L-myo-inositol 1-phosphate cytidylyltransferase